jgi:hypothetical protein
MLDMVWRAFSFAAWSWAGDYVISTQLSPPSTAKYHLPHYLMAVADITTATKAKARLSIHLVYSNTFKTKHQVVVISTLNLCVGVPGLKLR